MDKINLKLVIAMARAYDNLFTKIEKNVQEYNLNMSEFGVLELLLHKGDQPVQKIAEKILVTSGTMTYVIDKLQKNGLVSRRRCEKDKRITYISLTNKGQVLISEIFPKHKIFLEELFGKLSEESKVELVKGLIEFKETVSG